MARAGREAPRGRSLLTAPSPVTAAARDPTNGGDGGARGVTWSGRRGRGRRRGAGRGGGGRPRGRGGGGGDEGEVAELDGAVEEARGVAAGGAVGEVDLVLPHPVAGADRVDGH